MDEQVRILCVDDERNVLKALERLFLDHNYEIITAGSGDEGLEILKSTGPIQIVISDYRMPGMNGVDFLREVCGRWPDTVRIVLSGYADTAAIVEAVNEGQIYKFIPKPWNDEELKVAIANAVERYFLHKKNLELTEQLKITNEELQMINSNLESLVEERTSELLFQNSALKKSQNILDALPVAVLGIDTDGQIVSCNKKGIELLGKDNNNIVGMDKANILSPGLNDFIDKVVENGTLSGNFVVGNEEVNIKGVLMKHDEGQEGIVLVLEKVKPDE